MLPKTKWLIFGIIIILNVVILVFFIKYVLIPEKIFSDPRNKRVLISPRGPIVDRHGKILADGPGQFRQYRLGAAGCHSVGFLNSRLGIVTGIEREYVETLIQRKPPGFSFFSANGDQSKALKTTFDADLIKIADSALGARKGAIVLLKVETGEILALISHPNFDPNQIEKNYRDLSARTDGPFFNRAVDGSFPPGSVWKTIVGICLLKNPDRLFDCRGTLTIGDKEFRCLHPHGKVSLATAYAKSCNLYFLSRGFSEIAPDDFIRVSNLFLSNKLPETLTRKAYGLALIGQGPVVLSPLGGALLAATIANSGMRPKSISQMRVRRENKEILDPKVAQRLKGMMVEVAQTGTGRQLSGFLSEGHVLGLKTGTAEKEIEGGKMTNVDWEIGFFGAKSPEVAFAIVVEDSHDLAANECSPILNRILTNYFLKTRKF